MGEKNTRRDLGLLKGRRRRQRVYLQLRMQAWRRSQQYQRPKHKAIDTTRNRGAAPIRGIVFELSFLIVKWRGGAPFFFEVTS